MTISVEAKRAILSMRHIKDQSLHILQKLKENNTEKTRKEIDNYRIALSLFEEDKLILQQNVKKNLLDTKVIFEIRASLEISDILDKTIQKFIDAGTNLISKDNNKKELNFKNFDALIDYNLPKTWNFNLDVIFLHEDNRKHFELLLKKRGQKRIVYCGKDYLKLDNGLYVVNRQSAGLALQDMAFPIPIRMCFLDGLFYGNSPEYEEVKQELSERFAELTGHKSTKIRFGKTWVKNCLENLWEMHSATSAEYLESIFLNQNVIVVSPGPSLAKNIDKLKSQNSAIILAVAQAVPALSKNNITPDFVLVMDPQDYSFTLDGVDLSKTTLICPDYISKSFLKKNFKQKCLLLTETSCLKNNIFEKIKKFNLDNASSVSVAAVLLSKKLGALRIAVVGQDLSYSETKYYGNFYDPKKISGAKQDEAEASHTLPGYNGGKVKTNFQYSVYHKQLQDIAQISTRDQKINFYNCTEGGASISGFEQLPLFEFFNKFCCSEKNSRDIIYEYPSIRIPSSECLKFLKSTSRSTKKLISDIQKLNKLKSKKEFDHDIFILEQDILNRALSIDILNDYVYEPLQKFAQSNSMGFTNSIMKFQKNSSINEIKRLSQELNVLLNKSIKSFS